MTELDQIWSQMLEEAAAKAGNTGRGDVAEYLRLKATNDALRERGVGWLFDTLIEIGAEATRRHSGLTIERDHPHRFARGQSTMVGSRLTLRHGVRCLTAEAGWVRTPSDGVMRGGALAMARISHFGIPKNDAEFRLVQGELFPLWVGENDAPVGSDELKRHFDVFLDL